MKITRDICLSIIFWIFILLFLASALLSDNVVTFLKEFIDGNNITSAFFLIFMMFLATVVAPLAVLPIVPAVSPFFGPLLTTLYVVMGWCAGAVVAFLLARHVGRPTLSKIISLDTVERYESRLPKNLTFWGLVFLRMVIPVDVLSYVVGFVSSMSVFKYTLATLIGITPFSFIFSYGGVAFAQENYKGLLMLALLAVAIFISAVFYFVWKFKIERSKEITDVER